MQYDMTASVQALAALPPEPPRPPDRSAWGALVRGPAAAAAEVFGQLSGLRMQQDEERGAADDPIRLERERSFQRNAEIAAAAKDYARSLRPDPMTASTAENVVFGLSRGLSKAVGSVLALGPVGGAAAFGGSEAAVTLEDLTRQGVDADTALKAAAVSGVVNAASIALPMAGSTLARTGALYLAGGPGAFMAQQAATSEILSRANYGEIAKQFDPLDPLGLTLSTLVPLPFAGWGAARNIKAAKAAKGGKKAPAVLPPAATPEAPPAPQDAVDAAMVHNLTLLADASEARAAAQPQVAPKAPSAPGMPAPPAASVTSEVVTERGLQVPVRWRLAEASDLITSHTDALGVEPRFPAELQPRDRTRAASAEQIARIENAIKPELLGESVKASDGAPIIGPDAVVESGNARTIALRRAYAAGKAENYRAWVEANAERFGLRPEDVRNMRQPVLVRENIGQVDRAEFARQANEAAIAKLSPTEQAQADAARMTDLDGLVANEEGKINSAASADFLRRFVQQVVSPSDRGEMLQSDGRLSAAGQQRVLNAIFAKAYGDSSLVAALTESTDSNVRNVLAGLVRAAPDVAKMRDLIAAGARQPIDVSTDLVRAVQEFSRLREMGMSVDHYLAQGDMLGTGLTDAQINLLVGLRENARAPKRIAEMVRQIVDMVEQAGDPRQASLLGDAPRSGVDMVADTVERMRSITDAQLTDTPAETGAAPSADPLVRSVADRVAQVERAEPDLVVRLSDDGTPIMAADELAAARRLAAEGTDVELGAMDAELLKVAADCALSAGALA